MKRVVSSEWLDSDSGSPSEIAASLSDLQRINQWFGGINTTQRMVEKAVHQSRSNSLSLLEVAAGAGYVPAAVSSAMRKRGVQIEVTLLDRAASHLKDGSANGKRAVAGDVLALPFADGSFDLVSSVLFVHHLGPRELVQSVNEGLRVCRMAVLINDVVRHPLHLALVYAGMPLYRSPMTRHDAPASVRQAYTEEEMREMLHETNAARAEISRHFLFRMAAIAWKI